MWMPRLTRRAPIAPVADLSPYESDVTSTLARGFPGMYFPIRLEELFERETEHARSRHLVSIGILWIAIGVLYALTVPLGPAVRVDIVRLGVVTPVLVAVTFAIWWGVRPFT